MSVSISIMITSSVSTTPIPFMRNAWKSRSSARSLLIGSSLTRVISIDETWVSRIITALPVHSTMNGTTDSSFSLRNPSTTGESSAGRRRLVRPCIGGAWPSDPSRTRLLVSPTGTAGTSSPSCGAARSETGSASRARIARAVMNVDRESIRITRLLRSINGRRVAGEAGERGSLLAIAAPTGPRRGRQSPRRSRARSSSNSSRRRSALAGSRRSPRARATRLSADRASSRVIPSMSSAESGSGS